MPNHATVFRLPLLALPLALFMGCGGGEQPLAPQPGVAPEPAPQAYPPVECPEGATYREAQTTRGFEQICEKNGVNHGPFRSWYSPELKAVDGYFDMGRTHDNWVWWYENGNKRSKGSYQKSKKTGSWTWWHENGNTSEEGDFLAGRKAGTWTRYYLSGKKADEGLFHNGIKNGAWSYFRDDNDNTAKRHEKWEGGRLAESKYLDLAGKEIKEPLPADLEAEEPPDRTDLPGTDGAGADEGDEVDEGSAPAPAPAPE